LIIYSNRATSDEAKEGKLSTSASPRGARISTRVSTQKKTKSSPPKAAFFPSLLLLLVYVGFFLSWQRQSVRVTAT
jgi:hypothetical protein